MFGKQALIAGVLFVGAVGIATISIAYMLNQRSVLEDAELFLLPVPHTPTTVFHMRCAAGADGTTAEEVANAAVEFYRARDIEFRERLGLTQVDERGRLMETPTRRPISEALSVAEETRDHLLGVLREMRREFPCAIELR